MFAIASPGMVSGGCPRGFDVVIEGLGIGNFSLARRLVVNGVGKGYVFVEDRDFSLGILTDRHFGIAQGIAWAIGLDLVHNMLVLQGQVFG